MRNKKVYLSYTPTDVKIVIVLFILLVTLALAKYLFGKL